MHVKKWRIKGGAVTMAVAVCGLTFTPAAFADLFKCTVGGKVQYQETSCVGGEEKALDDSYRRLLQLEREAKAKVQKREADALAAKGATGASDEDERKARAEQAARSYFENTLIDPSSMQLRNLQVYLDVPGSKIRTKGSKTTPLVDVVCGEVNSKNRMGGYVGFKYFYWDSDQKKVVGLLDVPGELADMYEDMAQRTCAKLK